MSKGCWRHGYAYNLFQYSENNKNKRTLTTFVRTKKFNQQQREDAEERKSLLDQLRQLHEENKKFKEIPEIAGCAQHVSDKGICCLVKKLHLNKTIAASDTQNDANIELVSIGQRNMQKVC